MLTFKVLVLNFIKKKTVTASQYFLQEGVCTNAPIIILNTYIACYIFPSKLNKFEKKLISAEDTSLRCWR